MTGRDWLDEIGLVSLPSGPRVRGRRLADPASPADPASTVDFTLVLAGGTTPTRPHRRIRWPDFGVPTDGDDALHEAHRRARAGERVEVACRGGIGRTSTALAALAVLDGLTPTQAVAWVRGNYLGALSRPCGNGDGSAGSADQGTGPRRGGDRGALAGDGPRHWGGPRARPPEHPVRDAAGRPARPYGGPAPRS
jgi:hypothetical protein